MIPFEFAYVRPSSAGDAVNLLAEKPTTSRVIAGGTWLVPALNCGDTRAEVLVDLADAGLRYVRVVGERLVLGPMCSYTDLLESDAVAHGAPLLRTMAGEITGGVQIRNQGTLGGSLAAARAGFDAPTALVALDANVVIKSATGTRSVAAADLLVDDRETALGPSELIEGLEIPLAAGVAQGYCKIKRSASSWPIVTAAAVLRRVGQGSVDARIVVGGVAPVPLSLEVHAEESDLQQLVPMIRDRIAQMDLPPFADALAPATYRSTIGPVAAVRALQDATGWSN